MRILPASPSVTRADNRSPPRNSHEFRYEIRRRKTKTTKGPPLFPVAEFVRILPRRAKSDADADNSQSTTAEFSRIPLPRIEGRRRGQPLSPRSRIRENSASALVEADPMAPTRSEPPRNSHEFRYEMRFLLRREGKRASHLITRSPRSRIRENSATPSAASGPDADNSQRTTAEFSRIPLPR